MKNVQGLLIAFEIRQIRVNEIRSRLLGFCQVSQTKRQGDAEDEFKYICAKVLIK